MNILPAEVLINIFKHLHQAQKRQCLLVCRRWQAVLESGCLWDTVIVTGGNALKKNIQGDQTQQLFIETQNTCQLESLPLLFPHLRLLYFFQQDGSNSKYENIDAENFKSWQTHLESIMGYSILHHVLNTGVYHRLTHMTLKDDPRYMESPYTNEHIFKSFQNLPALSTLHLEGFDFDIDDYECLHEYAPSLTSLTLDRCTIEDTPSPDVVLPALRMTHLQIDHIYLSGYMHSKYVAYIIRKYVNLQHFSFSTQGEDVMPEDFFVKCVQPLVQALGNQVTTFGMLGVPISPLVFVLLDEYNYHLQDARLSVDHAPLFTQRLISSNQIHDLVSLTITGTFSSSIAPLKPLAHLKSLRIQHIRPTLVNGTKKPFHIAFDHFIHHVCPDNLKSLALSNMTLSMDRDYLKDGPLPLQTLKLESVDIIHDISKCLSVCCPQLKEIHIRDSASEEITLDLPNQDISLFEATNHRKTYLMAEMDNEVYVYDGKNNATHIREYMKKWYGNQHISVYPHFKLGLLNSNEKRTIINLTCRSLSTLFIDGRVVLQED